MSHFSERLKSLRQQSSITQSKLADDLNVTKSLISMYESGQRLPSFEMLEAIADYFNVPLASLVESQNSLPPYPGILPIRGHRSIPIVGSVACGQPIYKPGDGTDFIDAGPEIDCDFALIADGDSMTGDRINSGDIVFIRQQSDADDGSIVAVAIDDEMMLKHISRVKAPDGTVLYTLFTSSNPKYTPISVGGESETRNVCILGKAVAFRSLL